MSRPIYHVGVVNESKAKASDVMLWTSAVAKQVTRDFAPVWNRDASVAFFADRAHIPAGYWPVVIQDTLDEPGALGYHTDEHNQPISYVMFDPRGGTSVTLSHEVLEMLGDPFGNRLIAGDSPKKGQGRVRFLVEVCDPSEAFTYKSDGIPVSDFYFPTYFDPMGTIGTKYSFMGKITKPRQVLKGGYLSWVDSTGHWWQSTWFGGASPAIRTLGRKAEQMPLRAWIDRETDVFKARVAFKAKVKK